MAKAVSALEIAKALAPALLSRTRLPDQAREALSGLGLALPESTPAPYQGPVLDIAQRINDGFPTQEEQTKLLHILNTMWHDKTVLEDLYQLTQSKNK
ncbi:MAG: hypothetical protein HC912_06650 [Saprospiraceae bacterium]|nr:hypothetical protein [Saprospiraceae bacterium]